MSNERQGFGFQKEAVRIIGWIVAALTAGHQALLDGQPVQAALIAAAVVVATEVQRSQVYSKDSLRTALVDTYLQGAYDTAVATRDGGAHYADDEDDGVI